MTVALMIMGNKWQRRYNNEKLGVYLKKYQKNTNTMMKKGGINNKKSKIINNY
jgi:hypothetical protein